jgi:hypothetical protein
MSSEIDIPFNNQESTILHWYIRYMYLLKRQYTIRVEQEPLAGLAHLVHSSNNNTPQTSSSLSSPKSSPSSGSTTL